jgi:hypothetical protein
MIHLNFSIDYPFTRSSFNDIFSRSWNTPIKNKYLEFQLMQDCEYLLHFNFDWRRKCDHAGVKLELGLLGYEIMIQLYDSRHWNYKTNTWETYNEH